MTMKPRLLAGLILCGCGAQRPLRIGTCEDAPPSSGALDHSPAKAREQLLVIKDEEARRE